MFTLKKGLATLLAILIGVCSVCAQEKDWIFWQQKFFDANIDKATNLEEAHFWRTREPRIKQVQVSATLPDYPWVKVSGYRNQHYDRCITCHDGISSISESHPPEFGCTVCHGGDSEAINKDQAHATLIFDPKAGTGKRNPSSLSVVEQSCGQLYCHSGHAREDRNHIQRSNKSMMNTLAGMISGLRYQWAGQNEKTARYATKEISDQDGNVPHEWGALKKLETLPFFSPLDITELDKNSLQPISKHPSDHLLRQKCFKCHIDSPPPPGQYRSQGCAACHFTYSKTGLYEGNDPTISKTQPGHAKMHIIKALPERIICVQCHQGFSVQPLGNESSRVKKIYSTSADSKDSFELQITPPLEKENLPSGKPAKKIDTPPTLIKQEFKNNENRSKTSLEGMVSNQMEVEVEVEQKQMNEDFETDPLIDEKPVDVTPKKELSLFVGKGSAKVDIHTARGMDCIDCHTQMDIMGDGNLYSKQHQAVEIRCETCHGDKNTFPVISKVTDPNDAVIRLSKHYQGKINSVGDWMAVSKRKRRISNVKVQNGKMVVIGKRNGLVYDIPLVRDKMAHFIPQHQSRLECTACHSQWVVKCQGCHTSMELGKAELNIAEKILIKIQQPALMIGPRGKVAPMLDQPERHFSILDEKDNPVPALGSEGKYRGKYKEWQYTNPNGLSGSNLAYSLNPHSTGTKVRSCESCHLSPEALGLGKGNLQIGSNNSGKNDLLITVNRSDKQSQSSAFDPQAKVSIRGEILAGSHQVNARPFNQKEITRILRVGNCIPCHDKYGDPIYQDINKSYSFEKTLEHRQLRKQILNSRLTQP